MIDIECACCDGQVMWKYTGLKLTGTDPVMYYCKPCGNEKLTRLIWLGSWEPMIGPVPKKFQPDSGALKPM